MKYKIIAASDSHGDYWYACPDNLWSKITGYDFLLAGISGTVSRISPNSTVGQLENIINIKKPRVITIIEVGK